MEFYLSDEIVQKIFNANSREIYRNDLKQLKIPIRMTNLILIFILILWF